MIYLFFPFEERSTTSDENRNESIYLKPIWNRKLLAKADRSRLVEGEHCDFCGFPFNCMTPLCFRQPRQRLNY